MYRYNMNATLVLDIWSLVIGGSDAVGEKQLICYKVEENEWENAGKCRIKIRLGFGWA